MKAPEYKPYEMSAFRDLMVWAYNMGLYGGRRELFTITMLGEFEGFSGRATETWEHRFIVSNCEIPEIHIKAHKAEGETLDEACRKLYAMLGKDIEDRKEVEQ